MTLTTGTDKHLTQNFDWSLITSRLREHKSWRRQGHAETTLMSKIARPKNAAMSDNLDEKTEKPLEPVTNFQTRDLLRVALRLEPSIFTIEQTEQGKPAASNQLLSLALASPTSSPKRPASRQGQTSPERSHRRNILPIRRDMDHGNYND